MVLSEYCTWKILRDNGNKRLWSRAAFFALLLLFPLLGEAEEISVERHLQVSLERYQLYMCWAGSKQSLMDRLHQKQYLHLQPGKEMQTTSHRKQINQGAVAKH